MSEKIINIANDYTNSAELIKKFPVINPTPIDTEMEKRIQNRLLTGFENWNRGYDEWVAWGDILYTPESIYNVHAVKLSLGQYQMAMKATLRANNILMGDFLNMIICDDWTTVYYKISTINRETGLVTPGSVIEFVHFGDSEELGCRVIEGWAGTKGPDYNMLSRIQGADLKAAQEQVMNAVINAEIPQTDNLTVKYPVTNPTSIKNDMGYKMRDAILKDFDNYNKGFEDWAAWTEEYFADDFHLILDDEDLDADAARAYEKSQLEKAKIERISFDSMLISGDWAAIHFRTRITDLASGEVSAADVMQLLHFTETPEGVRVTESIIKH